MKRFSLRHGACAMKVGTDGVLIGAWCGGRLKREPRRILDVGCGSGLIALMLAQRFPDAQITAVEIEKDAARQAGENFASGPWPDRLRVLHTSLQDFAMSGPGGYDLIVSNPPFFEGARSMPAHGRERLVARHDDSLPLVELMESVGRLLADGGRFSLVLPSAEYGRAVQLGHDFGLTLMRRTNVRATGDKPPHRVLLEFVIGEMAVAGKPGDLIEEELTLTTGAGRNDFTPEYTELVRDFYTIL